MNIEKLDLELRSQHFRFTLKQSNIELMSVMSVISLMIRQHVMTHKFSNLANNSYI